MYHFQKLCLDRSFDPKEERLVFFFVSIFILIRILINTYCPIRSPQVYFKCISEVNGFGIDPEASISEIFEKIKINIESSLKIEAEAKCSFISVNDNYSGKIEKAFRKEKTNIICRLRKEREMWNSRIIGFQKRFKLDEDDHVTDSSKDLDKTFKELAKKCQKYDLTMKLHADNPALKSKICISVDDGTADSMMPNLATTQNHHVAGLILQMAINCVIESPFLIFDSLDYALQPKLIG